MKRIVPTLLAILLFIAFSNNITGSIPQAKKEENFLTKYRNTTWTNGFRNYTFVENYSKRVDVILPLCDTCTLPTTECNMCGYTWMSNKIGEFSFGSNYQNDFFYEESYTRFYEDTNNTIYSVEVRKGYTKEYKSDKIKWILSSSDSSAIHDIKVRNKPVLDAYQRKKDREQEVIEKDFLDNK